MNKPLLEILHEDESLVIVNKTSGLLVHATSIDPHETQFAMQILRDQIGQKVFTVHRLDKATSGALIFAKSSEVAKLIGEEFLHQRVTKKYLAVVRGKFENETFIDHPLREIQDRKSDQKAQKSKAPQAAQTHIKSLATVELLMAVGRYPTSRYSLIEATPRTGRKHQIRRHLKHISHPIIGDVNYGSGEHNRFFQKHFENRRLLLACTHLEFTHPLTQKRMNIEAPLAPEFSKTLQQLGLK